MQRAAALLKARLADALERVCILEAALEQRDRELAELRAEPDEPEPADG